jgi:4-amino-4-deoxy-L-arabinose transferase-like glycosyltransferase
LNSLRTAKRFVFPLLGLWLLLYGSFSLLKPPLLDGTDAVQAEAAREMAVAGDWITPHVNGVRYLGVSPLVTWTTAASFRFFGVSDWAARLPMALFALALFGVILALGARLFLTPTAGLYASLILLTSIGIFLFAHLLYPQIPSALWLALALYFFWRSLRHEHASHSTAIGFGAVCALGALTQGLAGVLIPVIIVLLFLAIKQKMRHLLHWHPILGILVFLVIVLPWHIAIHHANRFHPNLIGSHHGTPLLLDWAFLLLWITPWWVFSIAAIAERPGRVIARGVTRRVESDCVNRDCAQEARLLLLLWLAVAALAIIFTRHNEYSVLPALPPLALLAGGWLAADEAAPSRMGRIIAWVFFIAGGLKGLAILVIAFRSPFPAPGVDIGTLLHLHPGQHRLFLGHLSDLTMASMGLFRIPLFIVAASTLVGVTANLYFRMKNQARLANCFLAGMMVFILIAGHIALNTFSPVVSSAILAEAIKPEVQPEDTVIVNGPYAEASALGFYLERQLRLMNTTRNEMGQFSSDASNIMESPESLAARWSGEGRVFLWTTPESAPTLPGPVYLIGRDGGREILSNQPNSGGASF